MDSDKIMVILIVVVKQLFVIMCSGVESRRAV